MKIKLIASKNTFGKIGCLCLFNFLNEAGKKFFSDIEYNILTVDIQNPIMDAPKPMNTEKNP